MAVHAGGGLVDVAGNSYRILCLIPNDKCFERLSTIVSDRLVGGNEFVLGSERDLYL